MTTGQKSATTSLTPRVRSRLRRWTVRIARIAVLVYLGLCLALYLFQNVIIFPGAYVHGNEAADVQPAPGREVIELHTPDGRRVAAIFGTGLSEEFPPGPRPTILYLYGNGDCIKTSLGQYTEFRQLGANVMIPEFIGYPMSGGKPTEAGFYATAEAAYQYLLKRPEVDPKQIIIVGRSLGCGPAIDLASRKPVEGLATFSAFTTMDEMARKIMPWFPTGLFLHSHFNNLQKIGDVKCPIFLAHGTDDDFVPFTMMGRLAEAAKAPIVVYPIPGADHNNIFQINDGKLLPTFGRFLQSLHPATQHQ
jgi:pimeloyl-ACP methyl ester carboxylesterase